MRIPGRLETATRLAECLEWNNRSVAAPKQPRLAVLRNLARIVVGYNDHLREESYNHYIFGTGWNGVCARKRFAFTQFGGSVWESNSNPTFLTLGGS